mgnify:CR=1 FL=1
MILNGISDFVTKQDLVDRSVFVRLQPIDHYRVEHDLWAEFKRVHPRALGALLDLVSLALARCEHTKTPNIRLADWGHWVCAAEEGFTRAGGFLEAFLGMRQESVETALDGEPVYHAVVRLLEETPRVVASASELLTRFKELVDPVSLPKTAHHLSTKLQTLAPALRRVGIRVERQKRTKSGRGWLLEKLNQTPPEDGGPSYGGSHDPDERAGGVPGPSNAEPEPPASPASPASPPQDFCVQDEKNRVTLKSRVSVTQRHLSVTSASPPPYHLLTNPEDLHRAVEALLQAPAVAVDLETTGLYPWRDRPRLLSFCGGGEVFLVDLWKLPPEAVRNELQPLFTEARLVTHNGTFDYGFLRSLGLEPEGALFDTGLAEQLIRGARLMPSLSELSEVYLGERPDKTLQRSDWSGELSHDQLVYAALDAFVTLQIHYKQTERLKELGLERAAEIDFQAIPAVSWMWTTGVGFDPERWKEAAQAEAEKEREALLTLQTFDPNVNWKSRAQAKRALAKRGLFLPDMRRETLERYRHDEVVGALLRYYQAVKRIGTYGPAWEQFIQPETGRIHPEWRVIGAETGRMSSSKPNLMQIPRAPEYRACFRAAPGLVFVKADYSQIELRLGALVARDEVMLEAFRKGEDLHTKTAAVITGKAREEVTKTDRQHAKAVNFGFLYGMGARTFQEYAFSNYGVKLTLEEAFTTRERFFSVYTGLKRWHETQTQEEEEVRTLSGRRRVTGKITEKLNTPVQGSGADMLKRALGLLWKERARFHGARPVLAVHDELVIEAPVEHAEAVKERLVELMQRAGEEITNGEVPIEVEAAIFEDWGVTPFEPNPALQ